MTNITTVATEKPLTTTKNSPEAQKNRITVTNESIFTQKENAQKAENTKKLEEYKKEQQEKLFTSGWCSGILGMGAMELLMYFTENRSFLKQIMIGAPVCALFAIGALAITKNIIDSNIKNKEKELGLVKEPSKENK